MFLAIKELLKEKSRFALIVAVIVLVSYLAYFLTSLAYGLATSYTRGIDAWDASGIFIEKDSEKNIGRSLLTSEKYADMFNDQTMELLGVGGVSLDGGTQAEDITIFGIDTNDRLSPTVKEGRGIEADDEIVAASSLKDSGFSLGDKIRFKSSGKDFYIAGFTNDLTFQTQSIVYMKLPAWRELAAETSGMTAMRDDTTVSAIVTFADEGSFDYPAGKMTWQTIRDYSFTLPGYQAQVLTFGLMIGFLILIATLVLAVFMYILTIQKRSIFGVLKAEGISSAYIARSVLLQSVILAALGLAIGLGLAVLSGYLLAGKVPFRINGLFYSVIALIFVIGAMIGSLVSVASVSKIDPVEAIQ